MREQHVIPRDRAYEERVRESFSRQSHMASLGARIVFIGPGEVHLALPFASQFCQQNGFMHAGAIASVPTRQMAMLPTPWPLPTQMSWRWSSRSTCWHRLEVRGFSPVAAFCGPAGL